MHECYVQRSVGTWIAANDINQSTATAGTLEASHSEALPVHDSTELQPGMETLCSSQTYPPPFDDYLDPAMVAKRIRKAAWSLADSRSLCPDPKVRCEVLWHLTVKDFVQLGFGAAMSAFEPLRAYVEYMVAN